MNESIVYIVHCVDTEGPLFESLDATFTRLHELFGLDLDPDADLLRRLQNQEVDLGGVEAAVAKVVDPHLLAYNDSWEKIDSMLDQIMSEEFRNKDPDSFGGGWVYNWHCLDHVGYDANPRRRDIGFGKVFSHYRDRLSKGPRGGDAIHFHHHPVAFSRAANHSATHFFSPSSEIFEILARHLIDREWFPCVNRPGFHAERPDSHWFLEQFIPFDIANNRADAGDDKQSDVATGRFGDWRRAPKTWTPYHPDHDDYQIEGNCRRWIARSLNVGTRYNLLTEKDVEQAFKEAQKGKSTVLSINNHDHRDMRPDIDYVRALLEVVAPRYTDVKFKYSEARKAMRDALCLEVGVPIKFTIEFERGTLRIDADRPTFGPQPFFAFKAKDGRYLHDNLAIQNPFLSWTYEFDEMSMPLERIETIGIGACDAVGNVTTVKIDPGSKETTQAHI